MEGEDNRELLMERDSEEQKRIRWERINEEIKGEGFPIFTERVRGIEMEESGQI